MNPLQVRKSTSSSIGNSPPKHKSFKSALPSVITSPRSKTAAELAAIDGKFQNRLKKLDFNEFLSGLLYRVRKGEFTPEHGASASAVVQELQPPPQLPIKYTTPVLPPPPPPKKPPPITPQTSFFYKEGSLTNSESSTGKQFIRYNFSLINHLSLGLRFSRLQKCLKMCTLDMSRNHNGVSSCFSRQD